MNFVSWCTRTGLGSLRFRPVPGFRGLASHRIINALNPDLSAFAAHRKLIQFNGLADPNLPTETSINYYESVVSREGGLAKTADFYRLFLVPGMGHCMGAYDVDWIEAWINGSSTASTGPVIVIDCRRQPVRLPQTVGRPPRGSGATKHRIPPICAYPDMARYDGAGSADAAGSFSARWRRGACGMAMVRSN